MYLSKQELFESIRLIRPLLILLVCVAHLPGVHGYSSDFDQFNNLETLYAVYLKDFLARGAVPILTVISGYLAYYSFNKRSYLSFMFEKVKRLFVPFLTWNLIALFVIWIAFKMLGVSLRNIENIKSYLDIFYAILGLNLELPINAPTYFVRDLFMIMLAVPLIHILCKNKWVFVIFITLYSTLIWGPSVFVYYGDSFSAHILYRRDMIAFFSLGYFISQHNIKIPKVSLYSSLMCLLLLAVIGVFVSMYISATTPFFDEYVVLRYLFGAIFVFCAPVFFSVLVAIRDAKVGRFIMTISPYSFTLFLSHTLSAYAFLFFTSKVMNWRVNETFPIWQINLYIFFYCVFLIFSAFVILNLWKVSMNMLKYYKPRVLREKSIEA